MMLILLGVSLCCLIPPFTPIGVGGLAAWLVLTITFRAADGGVEVASAVTLGGNTTRGCLWYVLVSAFVLLGGITSVAVLFAVAATGR